MNADLGEVFVGNADWPTLFELDVGEKYRLRRVVEGAERTAEIRLLGLRAVDQPLPFARGQRGIGEVRARVAVDGVEGELVGRAYQMPQIVNGVRIGVETAKEWAGQGLRTVEGVTRELRLAAVFEGETWGPAAARFPIRDYRWRSSTYMNTWGSVVPQPDRLYYHRGEDYGAEPDILEVVAVHGGRVTHSPLPNGDGASNRLSILEPSGVATTYAHMDIEHVSCAMEVGTAVVAGRVLGRTGMTWQGKRSQTADPHLHVGFALAGPDGEPRTRFNSFPTLAEAYLRDYDDACLPMAGGYIFALPGQPVRLDGTRSLARAGRRIMRHVWTLSDGRSVEAASAAVTYKRPGYYVEKLTVVADDGTAWSDIAQVCVLDPGREAPRGFAGWLYHTPVRGIWPGTTVTFRAGLWRRATVAIDFGDGTAPVGYDRAVSHAYSQPGLYTVLVRGTDAAQPLTIGALVRVDKASESQDRQDGKGTR